MSCKNNGFLHVCALRSYFFHNWSKYFFKSFCFLTDLIYDVIFSGDIRIKTGRIIPRDLQMFFLVDFVAVAVNAIMFALVERYPLISPRLENSFLNCFPLHKNNNI